MNPIVMGFSICLTVLPIICQITKGIVVICAIFKKLMKYGYFSELNNLSILEPYYALNNEWFPIIRNFITF